MTKQAQVLALVRSFSERDDARFQAVALQMTQDALMARPAAEWIEQLRQFDIPCTVVHTYEDIREDPQALANGYVHEDDHPVWGRVAINGPVAQLSATPAEIRFAAPVTPGDHSHEILDEAGFTADEIAILAEAGVVWGMEAVK